MPPHQVTLFDISYFVSFDPGFMPFGSFLSDRKHPLEQKDFAGLLFNSETDEGLNAWLCGLDFILNICVF